MIAVNKMEKQTILERYPHTHFVRTMRADSKRHHYYMTEEGAPMRLLREMRGEITPRRNNRRGV